MDNSVSKYRKSVLKGGRSGKVGKRSKAGNVEEDRISALPDAVLSFILSFLPTVNVIQTSVLSKRWKYLWTLVPTLHFKNYPPMNQYCETLFFNFVDKVMRRHNTPCLEKFTLDCCLKYDVSRVNRWINAAIMPNLQELNLVFVTRGVHIELPHSLYTCEKLNFLRCQSVALTAPKVVCLKSLKVLRLIQVKLPDDNSMETLLSGCSILEDLYIDKASGWANTLKLCVFSSSLKNITMEDHDFRGDDVSATGLMNERSVIINAPSAKSFRAMLYGTHDYNVECLLSVVSASLSISRSYVAVAVLKALYNVVELELSFDYSDWFDEYDLDGLPLLRHLRHLTVEVVSESFPIVFHLLDRAPNLEYLFIDMSMAQGVWYQPVQVARCLQSQLKVVEMMEFWDSDLQMLLLEYLLKNGVCLTTVVLDPEEDWSLYRKDDLANIFHKISLLPRASSTCQIEIS